jgi:beta-glucosidase
MTLDEKIALVHAQFGVPLAGHPLPQGALNSAGFNPGLPRLGIPPLQETDAGLGVANPTNSDYDATAMPAGLALGATFDTRLARDAGAAIGAEARAMGFSVLLGGGADLVREPRGGRNFEYVSEDPLLTGEMAGAEVAGVQSQRIVSTLKHFVLNAQENGRVILNAKLDEAALRESDLLAFELAIERGAPGAIMTSYNRVNGAYTSDNAHLVNDVLKHDWNFPGWVLTDWGGTHSTETAALAGLDQESGEENDILVYFGAPLKAAVMEGRVPVARLDDMVFRMLRAQITAGLFDDPPRPGGAIDFAAHAQLARTVAARGMVLLKNDARQLPLNPQVGRLLVVGGHADIGVMSGGGSSQVVPRGSIRFEGIPAKLFYGKPRLVDPSPPLEALKRELPWTKVTFVDGHDQDAAARQAKDADTVIVFADRWSNESLDLTDLTLPFDQDGLIEKVAAANPHTVVVLETPGGVTMPWLPAVAAVVEAWYPGERGGDAIADVLTGRVNPSGRLPVSFPASEVDLPRLFIPDRSQVASYPKESIELTPFDIDYNVEGADVGYKWFLRTHRAPLFPFGYGLSYTSFAVSDVKARVENGQLDVAFDVKNTGSRAGIDTPQVYLDGGGFTRRLVGWGQVELRPGETRHVEVEVDPRFSARFDAVAHGWRVAAGRYTVSVRQDALSVGPEAEVALGERLLPARHGLCGAGGDTRALCVGSR